MERLNFTNEMLVEILAKKRERGNYLAYMLEFELGREPTKQEIDEYIAKMEQARLDREAEIAAMPWHKRKKFIEEDNRIERVLIERYNVPEWLVRRLINYVAEW